MIRLILRLAYRRAFWVWRADRGDGWLCLALGPLAVELDW